MLEQLDWERQLAVKLNERAFEHAKQSIQKGSCVSDDKDKWSEHQPSAEEENNYIKKNGIEEYGKMVSRYRYR
jgi:hypothetical protein